MASSSQPSAHQRSITAAKELVDNAIAENKITVFSKSWCGYCRRAKAVLKEQFPDVEAKVYEIDERPDGSVIQDYLAEKTGQSTVPSVWINSKHIGGSDRVVELQKSGKLRVLLDPESKL